MSYDLYKDVYELGIHVTGEDGVNSLNRAVEKEEAGFRRLLNTMSDHERSAMTSVIATSKLTQETDRLSRALDNAHVKAGKLAGTERAGAISRTGLLTANILQDMIQGGPASGINNILGAANDKGIKALAGEAIAAAGGFKFLAGAFGTVALAAGSAFLVIDEGLKSNKLGWGDLTDVMDKMTGGVLATTGKVWGETFTSIRDGIAGVVGTIGDVTIGWNTAAEAVRTHKDEIDRASASLEAYGKAQKALASIKSEDQQESDKRGKLFGQELANLGGKRGIQGTIDDLARAETGAGGEKMVDVEVNELDEKGKPTGKTKTIKKSRRDLAAEAIAQDVANAAGGDVASQEALKRRLGNMGNDTSHLDRSMKGRSRKDDAEQAERMQEAEEGVIEDRKEQDKKDKKDREDKDERMREAEEGVIEDRKQQDEKDKKDALAKAEKTMAGQNMGGRIDRSLLRHSLASGGRPGAATAGAADQLSRELQARGMGKEEADLAAKQLAEQHAAKLGDEITADAMDPRKLTAPGRSASSDFARQVEASGARQGEKMQGSVDALKEKVTEMVRLMNRGPRLVR